MTRINGQAAELMLFYVDMLWDDAPFPDNVRPACGSETMAEG